MQELHRRSASTRLAMVTGRDDDLFLEKSDPAMPSLTNKPLPQSTSDVDSNDCTEPFTASVSGAKASKVSLSNSKQSLRDESVLQRVAALADWVTALETALEAIDRDEPSLPPIEFNAPRTIYPAAATDVDSGAK